LGFLTADFSICQDRINQKLINFTNRIIAMTDSEIISSLKNDDPSGVKYLYGHIYVGLCIYALRFTRDKANAEEMVQTAFLKIWENRKTIEIKESITAYLFRAVRNNCLNFLKHGQMVNRHNENLARHFAALEENLMLSQETGYSIVIAKELEAKISEAVENLPGQCREIFRMSRYEGLKHHEIAEIKGVTLNTVQKQISIALDKIKASLTSYGPEISI